MKKIIVAFLVGFLTLGLIGPVIGEHNSEFSENGCDTADHTINVSAEGANLVFLIDGEENPEITVGKNSCVKVVFDNKSDLDHDFTVVDDTVDPEEELIHMDTNAGTITEHLWQMPDRDVELTYFCEVPGHQAGGMEGTIIIGSSGGFLPGFELPMIFAAIAFMVAVPLIRKRK